LQEVHSGERGEKKVFYGESAASTSSATIVAGEGKDKGKNKEGCQQ
jgi:hypothetical protein